MKLVIQNKYLAPAINFLQTLPLKGADSRARSKLVKLFTSALVELQESEKQLLEDYGKKDDEGNLINGDTEGSYLIEPSATKEYSGQHQTLLDEEVEVFGGTYVNHIDKVEKILLDYDGEMSGTEAEVYDTMLDAFELSKKQEEK